MDLLVHSLLKGILIGQSSLANKELMDMGGCGDGRMYEPWIMRGYLVPLVVSSATVTSQFTAA